MKRKAPSSSVPGSNNLRRFFSSSSVQPVAAAENQSKDDIFAFVDERKPISSQPQQSNSRRSVRLKSQTKTVDYNDDDDGSDHVDSENDQIGFVEENQGKKKDEAEGKKSSVSSPALKPSDADQPIEEKKKFVAPISAVVLPPAFSVNSFGDDDTVIQYAKRTFASRRSPASFYSPSSAVNSSRNSPFLPSSPVPFSLSEELPQSQSSAASASSYIKPSQESASQKSKADDDSESEFDFSSLSSKPKSRKRAKNTSQSPLISSAPSKSKSQSSLASMLPSSSSTSKPAAVASEPSGQYFLDLGQRDFSSTVCPSCGMVYCVGRPDDEALHLRFCKPKVVEPVSFPGWKNEHVVSSFPGDASRIISVSFSDPASHRKKVDDVREQMDEDLGRSEPSWPFSAQQRQEAKKRSETSKVFLFIQNKKVLGCMIAERIEQAYRLHPKASSGSTSASGSSSSSSSSSAPPSASSSTPSSSEAFTGKPLGQDLSRYSDEDLAIDDSNPVLATCGIARMWVHKLARRKGVASRLLQAVRKSLIFGYYIPLTEIAFSTPTTDGRAFASSQLGPSMPLLVYPG